MTLPGSRQSRNVSVPPWDDADPYTMDAKLCDDDGIVRRGAMHHGTDYPCTGHAHFAGEHIRCLSPGHPDGMPSDLYAVLTDPGAFVVCPLCGESTPCDHMPNRERLALRDAIEGRNG